MRRNAPSWSVSTSPVARPRTAPARRLRAWLPSQSDTDDAKSARELRGQRHRARSPPRKPGFGVEESLAEFRELVASAGAEVAAELLQRRPRPDPATLVGAGKVEEIAGVAASTEADLVLFDHDLSPTQLRNLEAALPCRVLDRTQLILDIFARHARTREGQLQVELAQLEYMLPRLTGRGKAMSQLGGGIGTRGPGETQLETDRRKIQRRIDQLKIDLEVGAAGAPPAATAARVCAGADSGAGGLYQRRQEHAVQSAHRRAGAAVVAHVCHARSKTCARSSCPAGARFCCRTRWDSFAICRTRWSRAFARRWKKWNRPRCCCTCATRPQRYGEEQKAQVEKVLAELDALKKPRIEVLNKIDLLTRT